MVKENRLLTHALVDRLARVEPGIRVEADAVELVISLAEPDIQRRLNQIEALFTNSLQFVKHRGGKTIMRKDVEACLKTTSS